jgi:hypothetical protein
MVDEALFVLKGGDEIVLGFGSREDDLVLGLFDIFDILPGDG